MQDAELGEFYRAYKGDSIFSFLVVPLVMLFGLFGVGMVALANLRPERDTVAYSLLAVVGGLLLALLVWLRAQPPTTIRYYAGGLMFVEKSEQTVVKWDDIRAIQGAVPVESQIVGWPRSLELYDGRRLSIPGDLRDSDAMFHVLNQEVLKRLFPSALSSVTSGKKLTFGPLGIDKDGITFKGAKLPWRTMGRVTLDFQNIQIRQLVATGLWAEIPIDTVPNANLFLQLMAGLRAASSHTENS